MDIHKLKYHYSHFHNHYRVWIRVEDGEQKGGYVRYADVHTQEEAKKMVYELNGWKLRTA